VGTEQPYPGESAACDSGWRAHSESDRGQLPTLAQLFTPIHYVRLVFVYEDTPEFAKTLPEQEWPDQRDQDRIAQMLDKRAKALREAVKGRLEMGRWTFTTITRSCCCST
jgi:hypothetical protein